LSHEVQACFIFIVTKLLTIEIIVSRRKKTPHRVIDWKTVGRRLRELRGFDTTQTEFAQRIGVTQGYFSSAERGEREIGPEILLRISRECGKSVDWLLTGDKPAPPE
jgi:DNA-binding XRE family transcriptional regulator